jgi:septum formation protein
MTSLISIPKKIILASASPRRKELLARMGLSFSVLPSNAEETADGMNSLSVTEQVCVLARKKAEDTASRLEQDCLVIGADTIVVREGLILGKPQNRAHAISMLHSLQGGWHEVITGVALIDREMDYSDIAYECTRVKMAELTQCEVERYVDSGEYRDKAGGYAIQGLAAAFIPRLEGCYFNVVGLPIHLLYTMIKKYLSCAEGLDLSY